MLTGFSTFAEKATPDHQKNTRRASVCCPGQHLGKGVLPDAFAESAGCHRVASRRATPSSRNSLAPDGLTRTTGRQARLRWRPTHSISPRVRFLLSAPTVTSARHAARWALCALEAINEVVFSSSFRLLGAGPYFSILIGAGIRGRWMPVGDADKAGRAMMSWRPAKPVNEQEPCAEGGRRVSEHNETHLELAAPLDHISAMAAGACSVQSAPPV